MSLADRLGTTVLRETMLRARDAAMQQSTRCSGLAPASRSKSLASTRILRPSPLQSTPAPNAAGWNNTNVTVTFTCADQTSGIASCTVPVTVSVEGAGQVVRRTATDNAGNRASASATINLDKTPPAVGITAPPDGSALPALTTTVTGTVADALSGLADVTCNGAAASVSSETSVARLR